MAAVCVVIMSLGSLMESLDFSLAMLAGLVVMILATEYGDRVGLTVFAVAGILSLLLPMKTPAVFFLTLFGWYPVVQKKLQMLPPFLCRVVKTLVFNVAMGLFLWLSAYITGVTDGILIYGILFVLGNLCFVMYDLLLDRFLIWYIVKLRPRLRF